MDDMVLAGYIFTWAD